MPIQEEAPLRAFPMKLALGGGAYHGAGSESLQLSVRRSDFGRKLTSNFSSRFVFNLPAARDRSMGPR